MKWKKKLGWWMCCTVVLGSVGNSAAQADFLIENQRTNLVENATWGDTYVGKYTDGNALEILEGAKLQSDDAFIGFSSTASSNAVHVTGDGAEWAMDNLQIGSESNSLNYVDVRGTGVVNIAESLSILGVANGNEFILGDGGTLKVGFDFDAAMSGFSFESNGTLSVAGTLSNMDAVDGGRHLVLSGENAEWLRSTNTVHIGATSSGNSLSIENGANLLFTNLVAGAAGTWSNLFKVSSGSEATIASNLTLAGQGNAAEIGGSLILNGNLGIEGTSNLFTVGGNAKVFGDIESNTGIQFSGSGLLEAYGHVDMESIDGSGTMLLSGGQARWTTNANISIGATEGGTTLLVQSNAVVRTDSIQIGTDSSTGNDVTLKDGGKLVLSGTGSALHEGCTLTMERGWLTFEQNWDVSFTNGLTITDLSENEKNTYEFHGKAILFGSYSESGNYTEVGLFSMRGGDTFIVTGTNAYLGIDPYNLHVGDLSEGNTLKILNGAWAEAKSLSIGDFKEGGNDNLVLVGGNGTTMAAMEYTTIGGTLIDGAWHEGGENNVLRVEDGALFYSPELHNRNTTGSSGLEIASGAIVAANNYYQASGAYLTILTDTSGTNAGLLLADTAEFEEGARVGVDAVAKLQIDQTYTNTIVEANTLIVGGSTNGTTADLAMLDASGGSLVKYNLFLVDGTNMVATYNRSYISDSAGFDPDSIIADISDEIDNLASQGNTVASNQVEILNLMGDAEARAQMEQLYAYGLPTFMHNQGVFGGIDQVRARGSSFHGSGARNAPRGARGPAPHDEEQDLQPWIKVYGAMGNRDQGGAFNNGYDLQSYGTVLGVDRSFGTWLFGLAGGYAGSFIEGNNGDESDASTSYGIVYASYGVEDWFADLVASHGLTSMDNTSGTDFDTTSTVDASQSILYIGLGSEVLGDDNISLVRPLVGLQISQFDQDAYTEESTTAVGKDVDAFTRRSYLSILGAEIVLPKAGRKVALETQLRAYWLHEFNSDDEIVDYTLVGSSQPGQFMLRAPDSDVAQLGIGVSAKWMSGLQLRADLDGQISDSFYSATLSGSLLYEF
ncbi:MAG: autotransporter domain-containing protein [Verrucomicrobiota bacterium]